MPFGRCPICGAGYHLSVGLPLDEWYRRYWPQIPVGQEVPGECLRCWVELRPGHRVTVRCVPSDLEGRVSVGDAGVVTAVRSNGPTAVVVALDGSAALSGTFRRDQLFYVPGQTAGV